MRYWNLIAILAVSGCGTNQVAVQGVTPASVKDAVHCQISAALRSASGANSALKPYAASYIITLKIERKYGAGINTLQWGVPYNTHKINLGAGFSLLDRKFETTVLKGTVTQDEATGAWCADMKGLKPFHGDLGLGDWLRSAVSNHLKPGEFGHTIEFGIDYDGSFKPGFTLVSANGEVGFTGHQTLTNTLDISLFDNTPKPPQKVEIVNKDGKQVIVTTPASPPSNAGDKVLDILQNDRTVKTQ